MANSRVCAVIVTYYTKEPLAPVLAALQGQVARVIIVDNGSGGRHIGGLHTLAEEFPGFVGLIFNPENIGLAAAQNQGIRTALTDGYDWVLLLDDDSMPAANMVPNMLTTMQQQTDVPVGILAPRMLEQNVATVTRYLVVPRGTKRMMRKPVAAGEVMDYVATVIASGSMIHRDVFARVGLMRAGFFIDYIDHDFCLRARAHGFTIRVVGNAELYHRQGDKTQKMFLGRKVVTQNYGPLRRYYIFRNRVFFLRIHAAASPGFIAHEVMACGWDALRILALEPKKWAKLRAAFRGLVHGVIQPIPPVSS
jgi:rhamnosyltransferase